MEKTEKTNPKKSSSTKKKKTVVNIIENPDGSVICGWKNLEECIDTVRKSPHRDLLMGWLVFGYNSGQKWFVIVKNQDRPGYSYGLVNSGWTCYYRSAEKGYLETCILEDMTEWEINEEIIEIYKQTLSKLKDE